MGAEVGAGDAAATAAARRWATSTALLWIGGLVACVFAYFAVRGVQLGEVRDAVRTSDTWWLVPALGMMTLAFFLRALRWQVLFDDRPPIGPVVRALFVGYLINNLLPLRAGEA